MRRIFLAWLLVLPLVALSTQVAHSIAYRLIKPGAVERAQHLQDTGHSSVSLVPLLAVITLILAAAIGAAMARDQVRGQTVAKIELWPFAVMPAAAYVLQEVVERVAAGHGDLGAIVSQPTLIVGLALQVPVAFAALALARFVVRAAHRLVGLLASPCARRSQPTPRAVPASLVERLVPLRNGGASAAERAPPVSLLA